MYALLSRSGSIESLGQGWSRLFKNVNLLSSLLVNVVQPDRDTFDKIRFSITTINNDISLLSGFDMSNEPQENDNDISQYKLVNDVFNQAPCLAAVTVGEDLKFLFANTLYKKLVGGRGVEEAALSKIFDPFYTQKNSEEGTGLGLALCKKMITEINGSISADVECHDLELIVPEFLTSSANLKIFPAARPNPS